MVAIEWNGPITDPVGYSTVGREFLLALDKIGVDCYLSWGIHGWTRKESLDDVFINLFKKLNRKPKNIKTLKVNFKLPFIQRYNRRSVMMTLFETDRIPSSWPKRCNNGFRETWIPNDFNMESFRRSGVRKLYKMPYGVNLSRFNLRVKDLNFPKDEFKFFSTFDFSFRKNPHGLIAAYFKTFRFEDPVTLYVKAWNIPSNQFKGYLNKIGCDGNKPKIVFIPSIVTDNKMARLYKTADCLVMPSYGEGWSMPSIQAMACGTPVIATNWSGQLEFMNTKNSYLIAVERIEPTEHSVHYKKYMNWAKPNTEHLAFLMRYVFEHQKDAKKKGLKAHKDVQKFSWINAAKRMKKRSEELLE